MSFTPATHGDSVEILFSVIIFAQVDNRDIEYWIKVNLEHLLFE